MSLNLCEDHKRVIIHIDIDCFYAQVEMILNPSLRSKPLGIQQKYLMVTCNYVARSRGVKKMMSIKEARNICADLIIVSGEDLTHYRDMSYKITDHLMSYSPLVERLGFDENFVDVTKLTDDPFWAEKTESYAGHVYNGDELDQERGTISTPQCSCGIDKRLKIGSHIAADMRKSLFDTLGITSCAGISYNKLLSKLVAGAHKPDQQTTLCLGDEQLLMENLSTVTDIPGIGHATGQKMKEAGIVTVADLQRCDRSQVESFCGSNTDTVLLLCQGVDHSEVKAAGKPQSMSDEDSFKCCSDMADAVRRTSELLSSLLQRLSTDERIPATLRIAIRRHNPSQRYGHRESRQCPIPATLFSGIQFACLSDINTGRGLTVYKALLDLCQSLLQKLLKDTPDFHLTLINVCFAKLQSPVKTKHKISTYFTSKPTSHSDAEASSSSICAAAVPATVQITDTGQQEIDVDVLKELPLDIQNELLAAQSQRSHPTGCFTTPGNCSSPPGSTSHTPVITKSPSSPPVGESTRVSSLSSPTMAGKRKLSSSSSSVHDEEGEQAAQSDNRQDDTQSCRVVDTAVNANHQTSVCKDKVPPGYDPEVFMSLPVGMRNEVLAEWRMSQVQPSPSRKKVKKSCDRSITSFFK